MATAYENSSEIVFCLTHEIYEEELQNLEKSDGFIHDRI